MIGTGEGAPFGRGFFGQGSSVRELGDVRYVLVFSPRAKSPCHEQSVRPFRSSILLPVVSCQLLVACGETGVAGCVLASW